jgi:hypothetical protein
MKPYEPISLSEMSGVALLNRTDTKFVLATGDLLAALEQLGDAYRVLDISGVRLHPYQTLYFDTADFALYNRHHAGAADRYKVRSRAYIESNLSFFEVKHKTNKKRTIKNRMQTPFMRHTSFSKYCLGAGFLYPQLKHNNFKPKHLLLQKLMRGESHVYPN